MSATAGIPSDLISPFGLGMYFLSTFGVVNQLNGFWSPNKYYGFLSTFKYDEEKIALDKYTLVESERTRTVYNWRQYFPPQNLEREFIEAGFSIKELYSGVAGTPYDRKSSEFAVIANRV